MKSHPNGSCYNATLTCRKMLKFTAKILKKYVKYVKNI